MFNIKAPDAGAAYMHRADDPTHTATSRRATFKPGINDKITNLFARREHPKIAGFVGSLRTMDLKLRESINQRKLGNDRARLERMVSPASPEESEKQAAARQHLDREIERREIKQQRLQRKQLLSGKAREGSLDEAALVEANAWQRSDLEGRGYTDTVGLSATRLHSVGTHYLSHKGDRHGIRINDMKPPATAALVASMSSAGYDRGSTGVTAAARSTVQHALVGVHAAALLMKGETELFLSKSGRLDQGTRNRLAASARSAGHQRKMLRASPLGKDAVNLAFEEGVEAQIKAAEKLQADDTEYEVRESNAGIEPPQTSHLQRKVNAYYRAKFSAQAQQAAENAGVKAGGHAAPGEKAAEEKGLLSAVSTDLSGSSTSSGSNGGEQTARAGRVMRFAVSVANLAPRTSKIIFSQKTNPARHAAADFNIRARRSALQGTLLETVQADQARQAMLHFPIASDTAPPMPWRGQSQADVPDETATSSRHAPSVSSLGSQSIQEEDDDDLYAPPPRQLQRPSRKPPSPPPKLHEAEVAEDARAHALLDQEAASRDFLGRLSAEDLEQDRQARRQLSGRPQQSPQSPGETSASYIPGGEDDLSQRWIDTEERDEP